MKGLKTSLLLCDLKIKLLHIAFDKYIQIIFDEQCALLPPTLIGEGYSSQQVQQKRSFASSVKKLLLSKPILYKWPTITYCTKSLCVRPYIDLRIVI